jgi:hypothetical protein
MISGETGFYDSLSEGKRFAMPKACQKDTNRSPFGCGLKYEIRTVIAFLAIPILTKRAAFDPLQIVPHYALNGKREHLFVQAALDLNSPNGGGTVALKLSR